MNPPVLQSVHFLAIQDFNYLGSELLKPGPLVSLAAAGICGVPRVLRAFSKTAPHVPPETPASLHSVTLQDERDQILTHDIVHGLQKETNR